MGAKDDTMCGTNVCKLKCATKRSRRIARLDHMLSICVCKRKPKDRKRNTTGPKQNLIKNVSYKQELKGKLSGGVAVTQKEAARLAHICGRVTASLRGNQHGGD